MEGRTSNTATRPDESRRYRILEVIGEGGFGKVYRARLEGAEGFAKEVAIKLLNDSEAPEEVLQRFRDESRILGLVRDRAIVTVDPPTRLEGRWAVVMEYVDGMNCSALMKRAPFPPRVALEVVQEVARALDHVYNQPGPDGRPLRLIHRDIKPSNIQITPAGTVKILDFGIARADFEGRESRTRTHIGGTFGYIAPERLHGEEGPAADIYSLGVVLGALIAGRRCTAKNRAKIEAWIAQDADLQKVWALSKEMTATDPNERPTAREVEDRCSELAPTVWGESLRRWAEKNVSSRPELEGDQLVGTILTETMAQIPVVSSSSFPIHTSPPPRRQLLVALTVALLSLAIISVGAGIATTMGLLLTRGDSPRQAEVGPVPAGPASTSPSSSTLGDRATPPASSTPGAPPSTSAPASTVPPAPALPPSPAPAAAPPVAPRTVAPPPRPAPPAVAPAPNVRTYPVSFGSVPVGATIYLDGRNLGTKPIIGKKISEGVHTLKMTFPDGRSATKRIRVGPDEPTRYVWKGGEKWLVFY